jgi:replicative DNA helicase Mcm
MDSFASKFVDFQRLTIQEEPEYLKTRDQPRDTKVAIIDDIVGIIKPGSHISISGMVLATPKFKENQQMYDYALFDTNVYGFNVETKVEEENDKDKLPDERKELIMKFVRDHENNREEYFKYLTDSIAPTIYGHNEVKLAMIAAVLGGQAYSAQKYTKIRPYVHVLIVGDPGTGKSEIIQWIKNVVTRYEYASGQGSSKAGLTAAVVHDKGEDPELQAGTTVLADGGIAAIDEMDKMGDNDKSALHEQMEHGRVTINKWKFHESLNARATIIGAANPKHGQVLDPARGKSIQEQLSMIPIAIQTRFDLIFLFMDIPTEANDREMAKKMREARSIEFAISQDDMTSNKEEENELQERTNFIRDLFTFAKHVANDRKIGITDSAAKLLEDFYVKLRHRVMDDDGSRRADLPIPITTRQYGSLDRIATAFAKATFSDKVDDDHMNRAINLMNESMRQTFMDENGNIDATMASTGISKAKIDKNDTILRTLYYEEERAKKEDKNIDGVDKAKLKERILSDTRIREEEFKRTIDDLVKNGLIKEVAGGKRIRLTAPGRHEIGID